MVPLVRTSEHGFTTSCKEHENLGGFCVAKKGGYYIIDNPLDISILWALVGRNIISSFRNQCPSILCKYGLRSTLYLFNGSA